MKSQRRFQLMALVAVLLAAVGTWALVPAQEAPSTAEKPGAANKQQSTAASEFPRRQSRADVLIGNGVPVTLGRPLGNRSIPEDDPESARLAEAEAALGQSAEAILGQYAAADQGPEQKRLKAALRDTLAKQFDVQREHRELELARVEDRIRKLRDQLKKRTDARETIIERRLDQLIDDAEGLGWGQPAGERPLRRGSAAGGESNAGRIRGF